MEELKFVQRIRNAGGRAAIVGGWVRDTIRGAQPKDKDYVVSGMDADGFAGLFPEAKKVGKSFPVYLLEIDGASAEVALARTERKNGTGYLGFEVRSDAEVTLEDDLSRRDTTMNAIAAELFSDGMPPRRIDLFGGTEDIRSGLIRAVSPRFMEDPVRALRAARQAAVFDYSIETETIHLMHNCREELKKEPPPRIFGELSRSLTARHPSVFFRMLDKAGLLDAIFPEIHALIGKTQPAAFHPEGDAFEHTMKTVDSVAELTENVIVRFAALVHDIGKGTTPESLLPHHYGHESRGLSVLAHWNKRMQLPKSWLQVAEFVIAEHMRASRLKKPGKIAALLVELSRLPVPAGEVIHVFHVDHGGLPPYFKQYDTLIAELNSVRGNDAPKSLKGREIGDWIRRRQMQCIQNASKSW